MKKLLLLFVLFSVFQISIAQQWKKNLPQSKTELTFFDYQKAFNEYWAPYKVDGGYYINGKGEKQKAPGWKQFKRWEYYWKTRVDNTTGEFPNTTAWEVWQDYKLTIPEIKTSETKSQSGAWVEMGPANLDRAKDGALQENGTGRLNCMTFDPNDNNHFWVGAPSGGVWESTNGGSSWICLTDNNPIIGISDIAIPSDYNKVTNPTIYLGTGDRDALDDPSIGVLKSTDGGATWNTTGLTFSASSNTRVGRVICHPSDPNTIIAATFGGVYKSTDAGISWTMMQAGWFIDMELIPTTNTLIATTYGTGPKAFRSTDMGNTWTQTFTGSTTLEYRCDVAVTPANTNIVYLITDYYATDALYAIYKSSNGGASFSKIYDGMTKNNLYGWNASNTENDGGQGWYDVAFCVSNTNANVVYVGGVNGFISNDGALNFTIANGWRTGLGCEVVHADHHNAYFRPSDNRLFDVNDGGVYHCDNVTTGTASDWTSITDGIITGQIYDIGISRATPGIIVAGFQDNGTKLLKTSNPYDWNQVKGGDGMCCDIDPTNTARQWGTYTNLQVDRTTNTWATASSVRASGSAAWAGPLEADPLGNTNVYIGTAYVAIAPKPSGSPGNQNLSQELDATNYLSALDIYHVGTLMSIWAASPAGCWKSPVNSDANGTYTAISGLPSNVVTDIAIDEDDYNHVYLCFGAYDNTNVWETTDNGANWTDISAGLPAVPTGSIVINEDNTSVHEVYVGTDAGIYVKLGNAPWQLYSTGMPFVSITDLEMYYGATIDLYAATYGRGIWKSDCYVPPSLDLAIGNILEPVSEYCDPGTIIPTVSISNIGTTTITSATIEYSIDGSGAVSQNWSGSLAQGASTNVTFPAIPIVFGNHTVVYTITSRNGSGTDESSVNDVKSTSYSMWNHVMPYSQNFDAFPLGGNTNNYDGGAVALSECWVNETGDDIDWSVNSGPAPSGGTGPTADHTTGTGTYLYTESSGPNGLKNLKATSPVINLTSYTGSQVTFWYHMYGANMGSLQIDLFYGGTNYPAVPVYWESTTSTTTSISGDQGNTWYEAIVDISAADGFSDFYFTFNATTGADYLSEMAIDDFEVTGTPTPTSITWNGLIDSDWQNTANWSPAQKPISVDNITIPTGMTNYPVIDDDLTTAVCNDLTIDAGANITIAPNGQMTVSGTISNLSGNLGLILQSDISGDASLIHSTVGVNASVQRFLEAGASPVWHFISSPISNAPVSLFPTNFYYYDETVDDWWTGATILGTSGWTDASGTMIPALGYIYNSTTTTATFQGPLNYQATYSIPASYNEHIGNAGNGEPYTTFDGWSLMGNPFTSALDWEAIDKTDDVNSTIYYYDESISNFAYYQDGGISINSGSRYIPVMQGFFVKSSDIVNGGNLVIPDNARIHHSQDFWKSDISISDYMKLKTDFNGFSDETIIRFLDDATPGFDSKYDAYKRFSWNEDVVQIFSDNPDFNIDFAINTLNFNDPKTIVPLSYKINTNSTLTIQALDFKFDFHKVYLHDLQLDILTELSEGKKYTFNTESGIIRDRFELVFEKAGSFIKEVDNTSVVLYPNPTSGTFFITVGNTVKKFTVYITNITGQIIYQNRFTDNNTKEINLSSKPSGVYFVKIFFNDNTVVTKKIIIE